MTRKTYVARLVVRIDAIDLRSARKALREMQDVGMFNEIDVVDAISKNLKSDDAPAKADFLVIGAVPR